MPEGDFRASVVSPRQQPRIQKSRNSQSEVELSMQRQDVHYSTRDNSPGSVNRQIEDLERRQHLRRQQQAFSQANSPFRATATRSGTFKLRRRPPA